MDILQTIAASGKANKSLPKEQGSTSDVGSASFASLAEKAGTSSRPAQESKKAVTAEEAQRTQASQEGSVEEQDTVEDLTEIIEELEGALGKVKNAVPGKTADEAATASAIQGRNLSNAVRAYEKLMAKLSDLQASGESLDVSALEELGLSNLSDADLGNVLGLLMAKFDDENGTGFLENFSASLELLKAKLEEVESDEDKLAILASVFSGDSPLTKGMAQLAGASRPLPQSGAGNSVTSAFSLLSGDQAAASSIRSEATPLAMTGLDHSDEARIKAMALMNAAKDAGTAGKLLLSATSGGDATSIKSLDQLPHRLDILNSMGSTASGSPLTQDEFESLLQKAAQARSSDANAANIQSAQAARFSSVIVNQMRSAQFTQNHIKVELAPRGLGEIEVDVEADASGKMRAVIRAENPVVLDMLKADKSQLHELLQSKGFEISSDDLEFAEREPGGGQGGDAEGNRFGAEDSENADSPREHASIISSNTIDIRT